MRKQDQEDDKSGISRILDIKKEDFRKNDLQRVKLIKSVEATRLSLSQSIKQKKRYDELSSQLKVQDLFIQATSKRGMPVQIINSLLPKINFEISKILKGVVAFTVVLEADLESNAMDVFIDYGDSKRIIELASGMEKMISSLAIRVALINISSLPKTSMLIIDEGFGFMLCTQEDFQINSEYFCCHECYLTFAESRKEKWKSGWRPKKVDINKYIKQRKRLITIKGRIK